MSLTIA